MTNSLEDRQKRQRYNLRLNSLLRQYFNELKERAEGNTDHALARIMKALEQPSER